MTAGLDGVRTLGPGDAPHVVDVLSEAFFDYPVMRFVLGSEAEDYRSRLGTFVGFAVRARVLREEVLLGIGDRGDLRGAALVSWPSRESPPELGELRERVWMELGPAARSRYEAFGVATARFGVDVPHIHLNMIGVRRAERGEGLGGRLIERVHRLSAEDTVSKGVTLTTEDEGNVALYEHLGYELVGRETAAPGLTTWGFFRPDP